MKKYAKLLSLAVALCLVLGLASTAYASMPDVNSHWAQASVEKWVDSGLAKGYPDGTFKPDNNITRAEFVALLNRAFTVQGNSEGAVFSDVAAADWYYTDVCAATSAGYVKGYEDNTFRPDKAITRAEAAAIVARMLDITADEDDVLDKFNDAAAISDWAKASIAAMVQANLLSGYPDGTFGPERLITRAESIVTLDRSMGYKAEEVPVTGVKLDVSNFTLKVDGTRQLEATVMPANASIKAVTWKSGNEKVATVDDNGKVKAIGTGTTTITVTTLDGNKTATCNVAVIRTSGGGGGSGSGGPVVVKDWPDEMEGKPVISVSDFSGKTFATVTIKTAFVDKVEAVKINGVVANQLVDNKNMWRAEMPEGTTIEALVRKITITLKGPVTGWPDEMEGKPVISVSDFSGKTFATVTIKTAFVDKVEAVKINGVVANQLVDNKNMWRAEIPEGTTVDYLADKINIILKEEQPPLAAEDVIDMAKTKAQIDIFGVTNVMVTLKDGFGASSVTANNEQAAFLTDKGCWKVALGDPQEGDNVEIIVSLGDGQSVSYMLKVVKL